MYWLFFRVLMILLPTCFPTGAAFGQPECLSINGIITDELTNRPVVGASVYFLTGDERRSLTKSSENGSYTTSVPCDATMLVVTASGYQKLEIPVEGLNRESGDDLFYVPLALIRMDKQAIDRPYHQVEQKHYTVRNDRKDTVPGTPVLRSILVTDAITKQAVYAKICLHYTKTGKSDCTELSTRKKTWDVSFPEPDIIAIEVTAPGYQKYQGNLILEEIDGTKQTYEIKLNRAVTLLSLVILNVDESINASISREKDVKQMTRQSVKHHYVFNPPLGRSVLKVVNGNGEVIFQKDLIIRSGLNHGRIALPLKEAWSSTYQVLPDSVIILFKQGSYELEAANRLKLDTIIQFLENSPRLAVHITGHTDNIGDSRINQTLSEYRARVVRYYLLNRGISEDRLRWRGVNSRFPAFPNISEENNIKNRRVVLNLVF